MKRTENVVYPTIQEIIEAVYTAYPETMSLKYNSETYTFKGIQCVEYLYRTPEGDVESDFEEHLIELSYTEAYNIWAEVDRLYRGEAPVAVDTTSTIVDEDFELPF